jgi:hypothetical protein
MQQQVIIKSNSLNKGFNWIDFFSFRKMITSQIIQVVYAIGALFITLGALITLFTGDSNPYSMMPAGPVLGFLILIFGNILWRIWCELIIVFFRINNTLSDIDVNTRKGV